MNFISFHKKIALHPAQLVLLLGDAISLQLVLFVAVLIRAFFGGITLDLYFSMSFALLLGPMLSAMLGACEIPVPPAHRELKQIFLSVSLTYLAVLVFLFMTQSTVAYSRIILLAAWAGSVVLVPIQRGYIRRRLCRYPWWGRTVIFLQDTASCSLCQETWNEIKANPERGLVPVGSLSIDKDDISWSEKILHAQRQYHKPLFIWHALEKQTPENTEFFNEIALICRHILVIPPRPVKNNKFWYVPRVLGTTTGLLLRQNLSDMRRLRLKRFMDIFLSLIALVVLFPLGCFIALSIRYFNGNRNKKILYTQERIGQGGEKIRIDKFSSMVDNAADTLERYLAENEHLREEWKTKQKLYYDPRITPVGKWLRKTSLDELPQLINVFLGSMSLVGPRPIVENEIERYGDVYLDYTEVKPGITGLWQISGRNDTSYQERIWYDRYYVTNWSVWMDIWILARTIPVVIRCKGAY